MRHQPREKMHLRKQCSMISWFFSFKDVDGFGRWWHALAVVAAGKSLLHPGIPAQVESRHHARQDAITARAASSAFPSRPGDVLAAWFSALIMFALLH
jgi:hypothetical protein